MNARDRRALTDALARYGRDKDEARQRYAERLRRVQARGNTLEQMAAELGVTRQAVADMIRRGTA